MKLLIIGFDGATFDLIRPWVEEGHLPNLAALMNNGVHGDLLSTLPPVTSPAWPTFMANMVSLILFNPMVITSHWLMQPVSASQLSGSGFLIAVIA